MRICIVMLCWLLTSAVALSTDKREIVRAKDLAGAVIRTEIYRLIDDLKSGRWAESPSYLGRVDTMARQCYLIRGMCDVLLSIYEREGVDRSMDVLSESNLAFVDALQYDYTECIAATFGYALIFRRNVDDAVRVFEYNVMEHPWSWKAHENLGHVYEIKGDRNRAIECYETTLELDPSNQAARLALVRLKSNSGVLRFEQPVAAGQASSRQ